VIEAAKTICAGFQSMVESFKCKEVAVSEEIQCKKAKLSTIRNNLVSFEMKNNHSNQQPRSAKADLERENAKLERATEQMKSIELRPGNDLMDIEELLKRECKELQIV
jgi:hypothetical protein